MHYINYLLTYLHIHYDPFDVLTDNEERLEEYPLPLLSSTLLLCIDTEPVNFSPLTPSKDGFKRQNPEPFGIVVAGFWTQKAGPKKPL